MMESSSIQIPDTTADSATVMRLVEISAGYWLPRVLHIVADLGVADALDEEPRSTAFLASKVGADSDALNRALRLLASTASSAALAACTRIMSSLGCCAATIRTPCVHTCDCWAFRFSGKAGE